MAPTPRSAGLRGRCPRCGDGRLFKGYLSLRPACDKCGLDFSFIDSGDGPAVFVMFIAGLVVVGFAFWLEVAYQPPLWVHLAVSLPLTLLVCGLLVRPLKGIMVAAQFHNRAEEGRLER